MIKISRLKPDIVMTGLVFIFVFGPIAAGQQNLMPHLQKQGDATQLVVDGKPFLMLAGELGNSAASSVENMKPIWPRLAECNLNTVLMPVYWDLIEPQEGKFDFALVDEPYQRCPPSKFASCFAVVCKLEKQYGLLCPILGQSRL